MPRMFRDRVVREVTAASSKPTPGRYCCQVQLSGRGESHPPKNRIVARQETVIMFAYSAMKNMANLKLEYSV